MIHRLFICWILFCTAITGQVTRVVLSHAQGHEFFPLVVYVRESGSEKPIAGATILMKLDNRLLPSSSSEPSKTIKESFYDPRQTGKDGLATLHYAARWSGYSSGAYFRYISGIVSVAANGFKSGEIDLRKWQEEKGYSAESSAAFSVWISLEREGEQAGTGQPATRPTSKSEDSQKPQSESEGRSR